MLRHCQKFLQILETKVESFFNALIGVLWIVVLFVIGIDDIAKE